MTIEINAVHRHRKTWALTQRDLAYLFGVSDKHVMHVERSARLPALDFAFACDVLFGIPARDLFPKLYDNVEEKVVTNLVNLRDRVGSPANPKAAKKLELFERALNRAIQRT
jgi:DNA-binding XRE family transcriptional regulator